MAELDNGISLNIVILPEGDTKSKALEMSQLVADHFPVHFVLDNKERFAHAALYQAQFPERNLPDIQEVLKNIAERTSCFEVQMSDFEVRLSQFLWWNCEPSTRLQALHEKVLDQLNPLRAGFILPALADKSNFSPAEQRNIEKYGYIIVGKDFAPHITATRLQNSSDAEAAVKLLGYRRQSAFKAKKIALGYLGAHGTVTEIIEEFPLAS